MDIIVRADMKLKELSQEFSAKFPFLRLEFYGHRHDPGQGNPKGDRLNQNLSISDAGSFDHAEELSINGNLKVSSLEQHFQDLYGIGVQVMRRSGPLWLQTTSTDDWTLSKQNREGELDSLPIEEEF